MTYTLYSTNCLRNPHVRNLGVAGLICEAAVAAMLTDLGPALMDFFAVVLLPGVSMGMVVLVGVFFGSKCLSSIG